MSTTTNSASYLPAAPPPGTRVLPEPPKLPRTTGWYTDPESIEDEGVRAAVAHVHQLAANYQAANQHYSQIGDSARDREAAIADLELARQAAEAGGEFVDPGTPTLDKLAEDRAAAHRQALATGDVYAIAHVKLSTAIRKGVGLTAAEKYRQRRAAAANEAAAMLERLAELGAEVDWCDAWTAWLAAPINQQAGDGRLSRVPGSRRTPTAGAVGDAVEAIRAHLGRGQ
ncbi:hypothetical protein O7635_27865 [Asanoa sp. WMMD1127]|uniref:hypothetical protein n=1 Tax=Asanoa sp. WMMD1127 TaxID=3016107 RepID=UPI0024176E39|nr:hypothetical protein [Asanoa sp. WMMD1127]MDG4825680.1 hypothetical protein [Asanoa sp. WMMD1127]